MRIPRVAMSSPVGKAGLRPGLGLGRGKARSAIRGGIGKALGIGRGAMAGGVTGPVAPAVPAVGGTKMAPPVKRAGY